MAELEQSPLQQEANRYLADHAETLNAFKWDMADLFTAMIEGRSGRREDGTFARRQPISFRLIAAGDAPAKILVLPGWRRRKGGGMVDPDQLTCELLKEEAVESAEGPAKRWTRRLTITTLRPAWETGCETERHRGWGDYSPWVLSGWFTTATADAALFVETARDFLSDAPTVLARSHDNCCVCGRALTDGLSQARGIGPECVKIVHRFAWLTTKSLVVPQ